MSWFRYHTDALDHPKIQSLPAVLFKFWVNLLCVSKISDGFLPETAEISFRCRCPEPQVREWLAELKRRELIDETSSKRKGNVSVTPPEQSRTETEQNRGGGAPENGWKSDEPFARFVVDYKSTGAAVIDEDFTEAYAFGWKPLDWEPKAMRVKALAERLAQFTKDPAFVPKPVKFLKQEWKRPLRPAINGKPPASEPIKNPIFNPADYGLAK